MEQQPPTPAEETIFPEFEMDSRPYEKDIRNARVALYIIGALQLLTILMLNEPDELARNISIAFVIGLSLLFVGYGLWSRKSPYIALLVGLISYSILLILDMVVDPSTIIQGVIVKVILIVFLVKGIRNAKEVADWKKTFGQS